MNMLRKTVGAALLAATMIAGVASPAHADAFRINARQTRTIDINACSHTVALSAVGDGDTDLDFWLYSPGGRLIHEDLDETDITFHTFGTGVELGDDCRTYRLVVQNLGRIWNRLEVELEDID
jgi:hypothetical protein